MDQHLLELSDGVKASWDWRATAASTVLVIFLPLLLTYLVSTFNSFRLPRQVVASRRPPTAAYWLPWIGHAIQLTTTPFELLNGNV